MHKTHRRHIAFFGVIALIASLFAFAAPMASADENGDDIGGPSGTLRNFMPENSFADAIKTVMADQFDGADNAAHFTAVAEAGTTQVEWWRCEGGAVTDEEDFQDATDDADVCQSLGTDTTGNAPAGDGDIAFDVTAAFAGNDDEGIWDVVTRACEGSPNESPGNEAGANCSVDVENNITFDDAAVGGSEFSTGEITSICYSDTAASCDTAADYDDLDHGDETEPGPFFIRFTTSDDVTDTGSNPRACTDTHGDGEGPDSNDDPDAESSCVDADLLSDEGAFRIWETDASVDSIVEGDDYDLYIETDQAGLETVGDESILVMDEHWHVAGTSEDDEVVLTFTDEGTCDDPDNEEFNDANLEGTGTPHNLEGCAFDQFGNEQSSGEHTFELAGVGTITTCGGGGTTHDHDDDGRNEHCHDQTGDFTITIRNWDADDDPVVGDGTVTFCRDEEAFGTEAGTITTPSANHGCGDEPDTDKDTAVKHWINPPDEVRLVYTGTGDTPANECRTGDLFAENAVGDTDSLHACLFRDGDPVDTNPAGAGRMQWFITPVTAGERTATEFDPTTCQPTNPNLPNCPPRETIPGGGEAFTSIDSLRLGNDIIEVCWQAEEDTDPDPEDDEFFDNFVCASVQKSVTTDPGPGPGPGPTPRACRGHADAIVGTNGDDVLIGTNGRDVICGAGGDDVISGRGGADLISGNGGNDTIGGGRGKDNISGNAGNDNIGGNKGNDSLKGNNGNDALKGNAGVDTLSGGGGNDTLQGGNGNDVLKGGGGNDTLRGGKQDDALDGGPGRDQCIGGPGNDSLRRCP